MLFISLVMLFWVQREYIFYMYGTKVDPKNRYHILQDAFHALDLSVEVYFIHLIWDVARHNHKH